MGKRTAPTKLDVKPPSRRKSAKWAKLIKLCTNTIIGWPTSAETGAAPHVKITWPIVDGVIDIPKDWPRANTSVPAVLTINSYTRSYNCETILDYFYVRGYIPYHTGTLYEHRQSFMMKLVQAGYQMERFTEFGDDIK